MASPRHKTAGPTDPMAVTRGMSRPNSDADNAVSMASTVHYNLNCINTRLGNVRDRLFGMQADAVDSDKASDPDGVFSQIINSLDDANAVAGHVLMMLDFIEQRLGMVKDVDSTTDR